MTIPENLALALQEWLRVFTFDCYCADSLTSGLGASNSQRDRWQLAVDTIYRLLASGLLVISPRREKDAKQELERSLSYARSLALVDPFSHDLGATARWCHWDLCASEVCRELVKKHSLEEETVCPSFMEEVEHIFARANVTWTDEPLLPIAVAAAHEGFAQSSARNVELTTGTLSVGTASGEVLWSRGTPTVEEWNIAWKPADLPDRLQRGEYRYIQSQCPDVIVVVFAPVGSLDWNISFDWRDGVILNISEAR